MTAATFTWKRKAGQSVCKKTVEAFKCDAYEEKDEARLFANEDVHLIKRPKVIALEDKITKKNRLQEEGCVLAEHERYWEAIKKWDEASHLDPHDGKLYEMKAQAYLELNEVFPAISAAEQAVRLNPCWWIAHQTLGHAQLSVGEVQMALRCYSKACHIEPTDHQLWKDIAWANSLKQKSTEIAKEAKQQQTEVEQTVSIYEVSNLQERKAITFNTSVDCATKDANEIPQDPPSIPATTNDLDFTLSKRSWIKFRR